MKKLRVITAVLAALVVVELCWVIDADLCKWSTLDMQDNDDRTFVRSVIEQPMGGIE